MNVGSDRGSVIVEGLVSMLVFFVLVTIIVQVGFLVVARNGAATALDAAVRGAAIDAQQAEQAQVRLERDIRATIPGVDNLIVSIDLNGDHVRGRVRFDWIPPGPDVVPVTVSVERSAVVVVPP